MNLRKDRIDASLAEHKQNVEDHYNKFRIVVSIVALLGAFIVKDSVEAMSFYSVLVVSSVALILSIWYWAVDSIKINGLWHYMSSYLDIIFLLIMLWALGGYYTFKTDIWAVGFIWVSMTALKLDWKLTLSTGLLWIVSFVIMFFISINADLIATGTLIQSHVSEVVAPCSVFIRATTVALYLYAITKITSVLYKMKRREYEYYFNISEKE